MVNISALLRIKRFVIDSRLRPMKPWSERYKSDANQNVDRYFRDLIKSVRMILNLVSGNEITIMLQDVLTKKEREQLTSPKYKDTIENLVEHYNHTDYKKRHEIIRPFKKSSFKYSEVKRLGFGVSRKLWKTCTNRQLRNLGGGTSIPAYLQESIYGYLKEKSSIAANRLVKRKSDDIMVPVRYLEDNHTELYKSFPLKEDLAKSTFFKYIKKNNEFKLPKRFSDLCEYCENTKQLKTIISKVLIENNVVEEMFNLDEMIELFKNKCHSLNEELQNIDDGNLKEEKIKMYKGFKEAVNDMINYEALLFHKNVAYCQRQAYNLHRKNAHQLNGKIMIELDFKQKITIGLSPRQISKEYYNQISRSCLGFGVYFVDEDVVKMVNFDIISSDLSQTAAAVVRGFRVLRQQDFFKRIEKQNYVIWCDCGKHFRNSELMGYLLGELAEEGIHVNLNYFGEHHGKNNRDVHFSNVSKFVEAESLLHQLRCSQDIVNAILKRQIMANENQQDNSKKQLTYAIALDNNVELTSKNQTICISNVESYYNYMTIGTEYKIVSTILSKNEHYIELKDVKKDSVNRVFEIIQNNSINHEETNFEVSHLHSKMFRIKSALLKIKTFLRQDEIDEKFFKFFSNNFVINNNDNNNNNNNNNMRERIKPLYCRDLPGTDKKPACLNCTEVCSYTMQSILHPVQCIGQNEILDELKLHKHPRSRCYENGKQRNTFEAARELAQHYIYAHNQREPVFL